MVPQPSIFPSDKRKVGKPGRCRQFCPISLAHLTTAATEIESTPSMEARAIRFETFRGDPPLNCLWRWGPRGPCGDPIIYEQSRGRFVREAQLGSYTYCATSLRGKYHTALSAFKPLARRPHSARHYSYTSSLPLFHHPSPPQPPPVARLLPWSLSARLLGGHGWHGMMDKGIMYRPTGAWGDGLCATGLADGGTASSQQSL